MCTVLLPPGVKPISVDYENNNNTNNNMEVQFVVYLLILGQDRS
jgi:hypothetical protein